MKKFRDKNTGELTVIVEDLSFLYDREHFCWLQRHMYNICHRKALKKADRIIAVNADVKSGINRYYFIPKERIILRQDQG